MSNFLLIFICLFLGFIFRIFKIFPSTTAQVLNRFVIYISLPALTIKALHQISFSSQQIPAMAMAWGLYFLGCLFFYSLNHFVHFSRKTMGTLFLTGSLGNTSFVGFPLLEALFGATALSTGILVDQPGTFLVAGTFGLLTASIFSSAAPSFKTILQKIFLFPPFQAVLLSILIHDYPLPSELNLILDRLSATLIPLSLVAVGYQIQFNRHAFRAEWKPLFWGLSFKLVLAPLVISFIYIGGLHMSGEQTHIILVESAMAPMITAGILATEYNLNTELASLMIGLGIPLSMLTVPIWHYFIGFWV